MISSPSRTADHRLARRLLVGAAALLVVTLAAAAFAAFIDVWRPLSVAPRGATRIAGATALLAAMFAVVGGVNSLGPRITGLRWRWTFVGHALVAALLFAVTAALFEAGARVGALPLGPIGTAAAGVASLLLLVRLLVGALASRPAWGVATWSWVLGAALLAITFGAAALESVPSVGRSLGRVLALRDVTEATLRNAFVVLAFGLAVAVAEPATGQRSVRRLGSSYGLLLVLLVHAVLELAARATLGALAGGEAVNVDAEAPVAQDGARTSVVGRAWVVAAVPWLDALRWAYATVLLAVWSRPRPWAGEDTRPPIARRLLGSAAMWTAIMLTIAVLRLLDLAPTGPLADLGPDVGLALGVIGLLLGAAGALVMPEPTAAHARLLRTSLLTVHFGAVGVLLCAWTAALIREQTVHVHGWAEVTALEALRPALRLAVLAGGVTVVGALGVAFIAMRLVFGHAHGRVFPPTFAAARRVPKSSSMVLARVGLAVVPAILVGLGEVVTLSRDGVPPTLREALPPGRDAIEEIGRRAFVRHGCWTCHVDVNGAPTGELVLVPDLLTEGGVRSAGWHAAHLYEPHWGRADSAMPGSKHLFTTGPDGVPVPTEDARALIAYLLRLQALPERRTSAPPSYLPTFDDHELGPDDLYRMWCSSCHGTAGRGDGPATVLLRGESLPRDLTRGLFRVRSTLDLPTDDDLLRTITRGMPGSAMPDFAHLLPEDRRALVDFVKGFSGRWRDGAAVTSQMPRGADAPRPTPDAATLERGRALAGQLGCAQCHGFELRGLTAVEAGLDWTDEAGRPIPYAPDLHADPFKGGEAPADLYRTLVFGQGGSPMPSYAEALPTEADRWALVDYLRSLRE